MGIETRTLKRAQEFLVDRVRGLKGKSYTLGWISPSWFGSMELNPPLQHSDINFKMKRLNYIRISFKMVWKSAKKDTFLVILKFLLLVEPQTAIHTQDPGIIMDAPYSLWFLPSTHLARELYDSGGWRCSRLHRLSVKPSFPVLLTPNCRTKKRI